MNPADLRNATWAEALTHVTADMRRVHAAWLKHGPGTTRTVANKAGISLFTFRPRTTDLYKLGLVECVSSAGTSGVYEYRSEADAEASGAWREDRTSHQQGGRAKPVGGAPTFASEAQKVAWAASIMGRYAAQHRRRAVPAGAKQLDLLPAA